MAASAGATATALRSVLHHVNNATVKSGCSVDQIRVIAVSKIKPVPLLRQVYDVGHRQVYDVGHRFFDENYVQEIIDKAPQALDSLAEHARNENDADSKA